MRRLVFIVVAFLALGCAANVAVTWGIAWARPEGKAWESFGRSGYVGDVVSGRTWVIGAYESPGLVRIVREPKDIGTYSRRIPESDLPYWSIANASPRREEVDRNDPTHADWAGHSHDVETAYGFPLVSMKYEYAYRHQPVGFSGNLYFFDELRGGIAISQLENLNHPNDWRTTLHVLPYQIIWWNFLIDAAIYGSILFVLVLAPRRIRRIIRARRKQCRNCGYPIGSSAVCTECGKPVQ